MGLEKALMEFVVRFTHFRFGLLWDCPCRLLHAFALIRLLNFISLFMWLCVPFACDWCLFAFRLMLMVVYAGYGHLLTAIKTFVLHVRHILD